MNGAEKPRGSGSFSKNGLNLLACRVSGFLMFSPGDWKLFNKLWFTSTSVEHVCQLICLLKLWTNGLK
jgi:hypothetical protein